MPISACLRTLYLYVLSRYIDAFWLGDIFFKDSNSIVKELLSCGHRECSRINLNLSLGFFILSLSSARNVGAASPLGSVER